VGILSDLFIADPADAAAAHDRCFEMTAPKSRIWTDAANRARAEHGLIQWKNFTELEIDELAEAAGVEIHIPPTPPNDGVWLTRVPEPLVARLATADGAARRAIGERWVALKIAEGEPAVLDGPHGWLVAVEELATLARAAVTRGWGVFLWNCL
jgi:hypothetical protein